jgi:hypothetical protein
MNRWFVTGCALLSLLATAACSSETAIIVEVSRDGATVPANVDTLRFYVGFERDLGFGDVAQYLDDTNPLDDAVFEGGRDLLTEPYRLLLRPGEAIEEADMNLDVMVVVVAYRGQEVVGFGLLEQPVKFVDGKVLQWNVVLSGDSGGRLDFTDTGCFAYTSDGGNIVIATPDDMDCDGDHADDDCNDHDSTIGPSSPELCYNDIDDDCDGTKDEQEDGDLDGVLNCDDCDDTNEFRFPGNDEICDGIDNDCNYVCDDGELDADEDNFTTCDRKIFEDGTCSDPDPKYFDCDDDDETINYDANEICDGIDNNCNERCDEGHDPDMDSFTFCGSVVDECSGVSDEDIDCRPNIMQVNPGAEEVCDGFDTDCDGEVYPSLSSCFVFDANGQGQCLLGARACDDMDGGSGWAACVPLDGGDPENVAPLSLCDAYATCDMLDDPDPYECAIESVATNADYDCTLFYTDDDSLCPLRDVNLPNSSDMMCQWTILGGIDQDHYRIGLKPDSDAGGVDGEILSCSAILELITAFDVPPEYDVFLLWQKVNQLSNQLLRINLTPMQVQQCPTFGLSCGGLVSVPPG